MSDEEPKPEEEWTSAEFIAETERELYTALEALGEADLMSASQSIRRANSYINKGWRKRGGKPKT